MKNKFILFFALVLFVGIANLVNAQDIIVLRQELDDIREDIKILQRKNYSGGGSEVEVKVGRLDEVIRSTAGRLDELDFKIKQLDEKITLVNKDIDVRMSLLEGKQVKGGSGNFVDNSPKFQAPVAVDAPKVLVGGSIDREENLQPLQAASAQEVYQKALEALKAGNYYLAEENFNRILSKFPQDKLAGNAQYWLGETYYAKKEYDRAAVAFAKGYKNYKGSQKGPDSLLKLGLSMASLKKKDEACTAFASLPVEFPKAEAIVKERAKSEAKKLGCK